MKEFWKQIESCPSAEASNAGKIRLLGIELKQFFSSSYMTALQSTADSHQRWPLLNLVRQLLCAFNYKLIPKRVCDGYTSDGKKKYKRMFIIETQITNK